MKPLSSEELAEMKARPARRRFLWLPDLGRFAPGRLRARARGRDKASTASGERKRLPLAKLLGLLLVALPAMLVFAYILFFARPMFMSEATFVIRGRDVASTSGFGELFNQAAGMGAMTDGYAVREFLGSYDAYRLLNERTGYRVRMSAPNGDALNRMPPNPTREDELSYFRTNVKVRYQLSQQLLVLSVYAFSAEDAERFTAALLAIAEAFNNSMNERAHRDFLRFANDEVENAEKRLSAARLKLTDWRNNNAYIDPQQQTQLVQSVLQQLEGSLSKTRAEMIEALTQVDPNSPQIRNLRARIAALERQIEEERRRLTGSTSAIANILTAYEALVLEREFSEKSYQSAVASREAARIEATRQQKYIVVVASPFKPETMAYPKVLDHGVPTVLVLLLIYGISMLGISIVRDYAEV